MIDGRLPPLAGEVEWVVSALRVRYGAEPTPLLLRPPDDLDWDVVLRTADRNAVAQLVAPIVRALPDDAVPTVVRDRLDDESKRITLANLDLTAELIRVVDSFDAAGIPSLPFKGPVLAQTAYGDVGLRRFIDLDVLVPPRSIPEALSVLQEDGCRPVLSLTPRQWAASRHHEHAIALTHEDRHLVELHWAIADRASMLPRDCAPLFDRATEVRLGARPVPTLDATDQLTIVAIHAARHLWERLAWICDVVEAARVPGADADRAFHTARGAGYGKAMPIAFRMVERVLGTSPTPRQTLRTAASDPVVDSTCDTLLPLTLASGGPARAPAKTFAKERSRMMDRRSAAIRGTVRAAITPTASDWGAVRLPDALWPAYYPIRLARLLASYVLRDRRPGDAEVISGTR